MLTGLDVLARDGFRLLKGKRYGVVCNQASITREFHHALEVLPQPTRIFGPQHGLFGHTQDNMIEWEGHSDPRFGAPILSLYGENRKPTPRMLDGLDLLVIDIQDVGARYYTFVWTMALCMEACGELGIPVLVLDRPNPIGDATEGVLLDSALSSFVGLHPVLTRHGMTAGEIARFVLGRLTNKPELTIVKMEGWNRKAYLDEAHGPWAMPSPNMPTLDTAVVYPGACLLEATNLSEGRGTTRPFEIAGAPYVDGWKLAKSLNALGLGGVAFRPVQFEPTFNKFVGELCEGVFVHVTDRHKFEPVVTYCALIQEVIHQVGFIDSTSIGVQKAFVPNSPEMKLKGFAWRQPPYEYVYDRLPIDILVGDVAVRKMIQQRRPLESIRERFAADRTKFIAERKPHLIY